MGNSSVSISLEKTCRYLDIEVGYAEGALAVAKWVLAALETQKSGCGPLCDTCVRHSDHCTFFHDWNLRISILEVCQNELLEPDKKSLFQIE